MRLFGPLVFGVLAIARAPLASAAPAAAAATTGEPAITAPGATGVYLQAVHAKLHPRWTETFVKTVAATYPANHPLNQATRQASLTLTIRWDGTLADVAVQSSSGSTPFDFAAMDVVRKSAPYPLVVPEVLSDDGFVHLLWTFARDGRACAAGGRVVHVEEPLEIALPRLIDKGRFGEALRRVAEAQKESAAGAGSDAALDRFARLYLRRPTADPVLDTAAAAALASAGDRTQIVRLRAALASPVTMVAAARALHGLGVDVCAAVQGTIEHGDAVARTAAIDALRAVTGAGADVAACAPAFASTLADGRQPTALRLLSLEMLLTHAPAAARASVTAAMEDADPGVRGAALLASVKKGGGRPEMYRLAPLVHDKAVEVRAAASAGLIRAAGDLALDQLYLLFREKDPRPPAAVAAELAGLSSPASAEFLARMLKKGGVFLQPAARALAARSDAAAKQALADAAPVPAAPAAAPVASAANLDLSPYRELLRTNRPRDAAGWVVDRFTSLGARDAIDVLGAWLARPPVAATAEGAARRTLHADGQNQ